MVAVVVVVIVVVVVVLVVVVVVVVVIGVVVVVARVKINAITRLVSRDGDCIDLVAYLVSMLLVNNEIRVQTGRSQEQGQK